jgi:hypothetical protein
MFVPDLIIVVKPKSHIRTRYGLTHKYKIRLEGMASNKQSSLFCVIVSGKQKSFIALITGGKIS